MTLQSISREAAFGDIVFGIVMVVLGANFHLYGHRRQERYPSSTPQRKGDRRFRCRHPRRAGIRCREGQSSARLHRRANLWTFWSLLRDGTR